MRETDHNNTEIPFFGLYGEPSSQRAAKIHIEQIERRSRANAWHIKAHRHKRMFQILCVYNSTFSTRIDEKHLELTGNWALTIPPGTVHSFRFQPQTQGVVLSLAEPQSQLNAAAVQPQFESLMTQPHVIDLDGNAVLFQHMRLNLQQMAQELEQAASGHQHMMEWLANMVLVTLGRQVRHSVLVSDIGPHGNRTLERFRHLLEKNFRRMWRAQDYASALHVSVSTLDRLCQQRPGQSATAIAADRLMSEARRHLIYTQLSVELIAANLGYKDPAYFSRAFRRANGCAPIAYRQQHQDSQDDRV